ncbi:MAG: peptidoglycan bridge formation glycyltransferase FemA/FemB family protein, partial [Candidatus Wildermuthbacteria bacterium]|nr:peptidoglycan bridge formation glycyltransferase FemA/FemB family protein [Candidatus Wildermuthbacteria bacterium]
MEIQSIENKDQWEGFLAECEEKTFLHSWQWGEFCKAMGEKVWRLGVFENGILFAVAFVEKKVAKRGTFLLVPHGPVTKPNFQFSISNFQLLKVFLEKLKILAEGEGAGFVRINPIGERTEEKSAVFKKLGFREAPLQMHPEASWKLDITPSESELFDAMRKTTRYLVGRAAKNPDIALMQSRNLNDIEIFSKLHNIVSERQRFVPFSLEYLRKEFEAFLQDDGVLLFFGKYKGEIAAASFVIFWSGIGFYHHAVSVSKYAKFSIPYLVQWEAIKEAKRRGCVLYDFWGFVDPVKEPRHPWAGPTLFKL